MIWIVAAMAAAAVSVPDVSGQWKTESRGGIVEIAPCGESICGRLVTSEGLKADPGLSDFNNQDEKLRHRPLRGLPILYGFKAKGDSWDGGKIYNAEDGKTYSAKLTLEDANHLKVRGCVFVPLCKTQTWVRVK